MFPSGARRSSAGATLPRNGSTSRPQYWCLGARRSSAGATLPRRKRNYASSVQMYRSIRWRKIRLSRWCTRGKLLHTSHEWKEARTEMRGETTPPYSRIGGERKLVIFFHTHWESSFERWQMRMMMMRTMMMMLMMWRVRGRGGEWWQRYWDFDGDDDSD